MGGIAPNGIGVWSHGGDVPGTWPRHTTPGTTAAGLAGTRSDKKSLSHQRDIAAPRPAGERGNIRQVEPPGGCQDAEERDSLAVDAAGAICVRGKR